MSPADGAPPPAPADEESVEFDGDGEAVDSASVSTGVVDDYRNYECFTRMDDPNHPECVQCPGRAECMKLSGIEE